MKIGLVGLSQTGKTTIFDLLTGRNKQAQDKGASGKAASNTGIGIVPDRRVDFLSDLYKPKKTTYAQIEITDVAGFSATGEGQKSGAAKFLNDVRHCDALVYILRAFESGVLPPGLGGVNPVGELETLETELLFADLEMIERRAGRIKSGKKITKDSAGEKALLERCFSCLEGGGSIVDIDGLQDTEKAMLQEYMFLTAKPRMAVVNQDENQFESKSYPHKAALELECKRLGIPILELCGAMELEISQLEEEDRRLFMEDLGLSQPGIAVLAKAAYEMLGYISFFTVGDDEVKAWTVEKGIRARHAAGKIHSDIERGFIRAEVVRFEDIEELGSMTKAKGKGLFRLEGKEYPVVDGDVIHFRFNV